MDEIECTTTERETLHSWRFHHPHPRVQLKREARYLKSQGLAPADIVRLCAIATTTFYRYLHAYRTGGMAKLQEGPFHRRQSQLTAYRTSIEADLRQRPRKAKKLELASSRGVTSNHVLASGVPSSSLSSNTQRRSSSYRGRYHMRLIHSSASIVDQMRSRSSTADAMGRLCGISSNPALWRVIINSAKCRGMVWRSWVTRTRPASAARSNTSGSGRPPRPAASAVWKSRAGSRRQAARRMS